MRPEIFREHIQKCKQNTTKPFGVNIPLLFHYADELIQIVIEEKVPIVFTSAGNPNKYTSLLKQHGITVVHVVANLKFALKSQEAGVDAVVAEGFEAGGHNGREETTTLVLIPKIKPHLSIPLIAAGGIGTGRAMLATMALGAEGVQVGSRFAVAVESSAHPDFKQKVIEAQEGSTKLQMKQLVSVRLLDNPFSDRISQMQHQGASPEALSQELGKGRAKLGMFDGDLTEGELEIGQVSALIDKSETAQEIISDMVTEYQLALSQLK
jgi:enoyl-[acyl-carrier protein] reductase II